MLAELRGPWAGTLTGVDPPIEVSMRLSGGKHGSMIRFRGQIRCSGTLVYLGRDGEIFRFHERITASASMTCGGRGAVRLRLHADGRLEYRWRAIGEAIPPARARLDRVVVAG